MTTTPEFRRTAEGIALRLDRDQGALIAQIAGDLGGLLESSVGARLGEGRARLTGAAAELADLVGMPAAELPVPDHPVIARLFPSAYPEDEAAAGEFRRFTTSELYDERRARLADLNATLDAEPGSSPAITDVILPEPRAQEWLSGLNDLRLALATVIGVEVGPDGDSVVPEDAPMPLLYAYDLLMVMQDALVDVLSHG